MKIILAKSAGFCFGVRRAVNICEDTAKSGARCATLGPIIHNTSVTRALAEKGVRELGDVGDAQPGETVIIRSHGAKRGEIEALKALGADILDATCPDVAKIHGIVRRESDEGRTVLIVGEKNHPEVEAISSWCGDCRIVETPEEVREWLRQSPNAKSAPISVVSQTTNTRDVFELCCLEVKKECTNLKIFDTICNATCRRQEEAKEISRRVDAMIVIGGKSSANSIKLAEICRAHCNRVYFIESADDLDISYFSDSDTVGITAGASTPAWIIKEVSQMLSEEMNIEESGGQAGETEVKEAAQEAVESFEEMLEKSIKTLNTGEKVTGIIAAITPTEISVDLGTKQSGYIPLAELTDDPSVKVEDIVKIGDSIETFVLRVNDVEGTVMLSKKRLDSVKSWDDIEVAKNEKTTVEGVVTEENKGGVVVSVRGVRVFVPASQTGLAKDVPMSTLVKTKVKLRITEVNQSRRRVVGSIRAVANEERREKMEQIWNEIEVGKKYEGVVKSMTSYGAFVDIGGIDGMVHVSELSWTRIHQPSDVLNIGDKIEVFVISFDKEKKKISLGYKTKEDNPWEKFITAYKIGDTINVKIVKLMPFGAFAEIIPGVDGLIHISQITDHRIGLPSEVLKEGMDTDVRITDIDLEKHKVSLSIRALMTPDSAPVSDKAPTIVYDTDFPPAEIPEE
ncbi:4-hydroxy-3-methylbut-2-enyl diphosphate reductase [Sporobacter termitidis DSM 10068]|uniref:4-hydroxy-3-methylbut-2-enyl diphosphate reductase n=1 Tax=Sporobacter termitidis DSM 10068 TaxID=1123282 RepID=A0A1M5TJ47_9FIRM|nr:bifunctional 4-hydroxy-3-methylbut-2-enyl diphosphate reductase/30S ribosomal protein S1 [Sporobacter termitidis]SHH50691.1 4-hydroxy-3-methylbut-2-enyl diphosphate reductase [Sporobacter termitidis DSM 10068]